MAKIIKRKIRQIKVYLLIFGIALWTELLYYANESVLTTFNKPYTNYKHNTNAYRNIRKIIEVHTKNDMTRTC